MSFVKVELKQARLERHIFFSPKITNLALSPGVLVPLEWYADEKSANEKNVEKGMKEIPITELGEYRVHLYAHRMKAEAKMEVTVTGPDLLLLEDAKTMNNITKFEFKVRILFERQKPHRIAASLISPARQTFSCEGMCMILEQTL